MFEDVKDGAEKLRQEGIDRLSGKDKKSALQEEMAPVVSQHCTISLQARVMVLIEYRLTRQTRTSRVQI